MSIHKVLDKQGLDFLVDLVDTAGEAIMAIYACKDQLATTVKADSSPLTEADLASNAILLKGLLEHWPTIPVLSEESANGFSVGEKPELYWAVDPLDGTKEFLKGNGEFTVNVALVVNGEPQVGVIGAPALGLMYVGAFGETCDFESQAKKRDANGWVDISASGISVGHLNEQPLRVAMSRSHPSVELAQWLKQFKSVDGRDIGSSLKFCLVAEGAVDVYPRLGPTYIWDTAAGHALVVAAGGVVKQWNDLPLSYAEPSITLNPFFIAWGHYRAATFRAVVG
jgi:3'(2'), 5'-bisphosphate nucleotidase